MAIRTGNPHPPPTCTGGPGRAGALSSPPLPPGPGGGHPEKIRCLRRSFLHIERHHGRLLELGPDVGIDTDGRVWLLEVIPSPVAAFSSSGTKDVYRRRPFFRSEWPDFQQADGGWHELIICRLRLYPTPHQSRHPSKFLMNRWGCIHGQSIKIRLGNKTLISRVVGTRGQNPSSICPIDRPAAGDSYLGETRFLRKPAAPAGAGPRHPDHWLHWFAVPALRQPIILFRQFILGMEERPFFYVFTPEMVNWPIERFPAGFTGKTSRETAGSDDRSFPM